MKDDVREFYDRIGWSQVGEGIYQNSRYEDLRPVSQEYIHKCHLRIKRYLTPKGHLLLDAGSGPIQYAEYLTFSEGYDFRVCADMSITALQEAREKIGDHGMFVVADIANLPFKANAFDGVVSMHTIHHLPLEEHLRAYQGLHRVLAPGKTAVEVNGWSNSILMDPFRSFSEFRKRVWLFGRRLLGRPLPENVNINRSRKGKSGKASKNTFVNKHTSGWFRKTVMPHFEIDILVWRSASVHFLKNYIFENRGGRRILALLFKLEERFPRFFGINGTYPLLVIHKTNNKRSN